MSFSWNIEICISNSNLQQELDDDLGALKAHD